MKHTHTHAHSTPKEAATGVRTQLERHVQPSSAADECQGTIVFLSKKQKECKACQANSRIASSRPKRKALEELSPNSVNQIGAISTRRARPKRTCFGCSICNILLCQYSICWQEHVAKSINNLA